MRPAYRDRNTYLGDPAFIRNPLERLLSKDYAAGIRAAIDAGKATPIAALQPPKEKAETTHYSVVDSEGNAVVVTYTINDGFGVGVIRPGPASF
jgi:gamma-glutamyltranspeptidase/glutathione hydrolase